MMEQSKDLVRYRLARAHETLEDARILARECRWAVFKTVSRSSMDEAFGKHIWELPSAAEKIIMHCGISSYF